MLTDLEARKIASDWHGGQGSALYALSSSGAINTARDDHDCESEIADCVWSSRENDTIDLLALDTYVKANHPRGPVDGWSSLVW